MYSKNDRFLRRVDPSRQQKPPTQVKFGGHVLLAPQGPNWSSKKGNFNAKKERQMKLPGAQVPVLSLKQFPTPDPLHA